MFNSLYSVVSLMLMRLRKDEGQTMAEYGILIAVIALVVVAAAIILGNNLNSLFSSTATKV